MGLCWADCLLQHSSSKVINYNGVWSGWGDKISCSVWDFAGQTVIINNEIWGGAWDFSEITGHFMKKHCLVKINHYKCISDLSLTVTVLESPFRKLIH